MSASSITTVPPDREQSILKLVIEDYIETALPVPSRRLREKFHLSFSPASIRRVLHTLECAGLLDHIHTSSGRVPTDLGYRFYVDELMDPPQESEALENQIMAELLSVNRSVDQLVQITADFLARISKSFGFVLLDSNRRGKLTDLELIPLSSGRVLLVLGFQSDQIKTVVLDVSLDVKASHIDTVATVLRERLVGLTIDEIQMTIGQRLEDQAVYQSEIVQILVENPEDYFSTPESQYMSTSQKDLLLQHPEFSSSVSIQSIVSALDDEIFLVNSVPRRVKNDKTDIRIGKENPDSALQSCSVVSRNFASGEFKGLLAIIGPTRMFYQEVCTVVNALSSVMSQFLHDG